LGPALALYSRPPLRLVRDMAAHSRGKRVFFLEYLFSKLFVWFGLVLSQSDSPYLVYIHGNNT